MDGPAEASGTEVRFHFAGNQIKDSNGNVARIVTVAGSVARGYMLFDTPRDPETNPPHIVPWRFRRLGRTPWHIFPSRNKKNVIPEAGIVGEFYEQGNAKGEYVHTPPVLSFEMANGEIIPVTRVDTTTNPPQVYGMRKSAPGPT